MAEYPIAHRSRAHIAAAFAHASSLENQANERAVEIAVAEFIGAALFIEARLGRPRLLQLLGELTRESA